MSHTIQRCVHLKEKDVPDQVRVVSGITIEICSECVAEMEHRFGERPLDGETPIEKAAQQNRGGDIR